jgi:beta-galactosidase
LWSWEALAHGAEAVCYFRWRQAPFAQEQMHSGLLRPDSSLAPCYAEIQQLAREIQDFPITKAKVSVALVFDYSAQWAWEIQPHAANTSYFDLVFDCYKALRKQGLSVDVLPPSALQTQLACDQYQLLWAPGLMHMSRSLKDVFAQAKGHVIWGPRSAAKTREMSIPVPLPPNIVSIPVTVQSCESLRQDMPLALVKGGYVINYRELLASNAEVIEQTMDDEPVLVQQGKQLYLAAWLDQIALQRLVRNVCAMADIPTFEMPEGVRCRDTQEHRFWFNYDNKPQQVKGETLAPGGVLIQ